MIQQIDCCLNRLRRLPHQKHRPTRVPHRKCYTPPPQKAADKSAQPNKSVNTSLPPQKFILQKSADKRRSYNTHRIQIHAGVFLPLRRPRSSSLDPSAARDNRNNAAGARVHKESPVANKFSEISSFPLVYGRTHTQESRWWCSSSPAGNIDAIWAT